MNKAIDSGDYVEIILRAYPTLGKVIEETNELIKKRAVQTFAARGDAASQAEMIAELIYESRRLSNLKLLCDKVMERLSGSELELFGYKYFGNRVIDGFDYTSRKYFRRQKRALKHFKELLGYVGIDEKTFFRDYGDIKFIISCAETRRARAYHFRRCSALRLAV